MTYVSRPVRHVRDDPVPGETIRLLLRLAEGADEAAVAERVREAGGTVEASLAFDTLAVAVDHEQVADVCALDGLSAVETENTVRLDAGDAGEDVGG